MTRDFLIEKLAVRGFPIGVKFGFLGLFLCTSFAVALYLCAHTYSPIADRSLEEARAHQVAALVAEASLQWTVYDDQLDMYAALIALRDPTQKSLEVDALAQSAAARKAIDSPLAAMARIATDSDSRALLARFWHAFKAYDAYTARMLERARRGDISKAVHIQLVENGPVSDESIDSLTALGKRWNVRAARANAAVGALASYGSRPMWPIGLVMLLLTAIVLTVVGRSIALPLRRLTIIAQKLAAANVDVDDDLPPSGCDEIGLLSKSFGEMISKRRIAEEQLAFAAFHDGLTGLANRALLMESLRQLVAKRYSGDHLWAILFLDLDRFKVINDSLGHNVGDLVLIEAARRLERCLRSGDTLARLGGDEFIILLDGIADVATACTVADRVLHEFEIAFAVSGNEVFAGTSIGIATSRNGDDRPEDVLRNADIAMYRAKTLGKQRYELFSTELLTQAVAPHEGETDLARALEHERVLSLPSTDR
jgi:diguanylate cyclase (GGDEF)-like protein